jgi:hypothetical protein
MFSRTSGDVFAYHWLKTTAPGDPTEQVSPSPHMKAVTDPVYEKLFSSWFRIPNDGQCPQTQLFWVLNRRQNHLDSTWTSIKLIILLMRVRKNLLISAWNALSKGLETIVWIMWR